MGFFTGLWYFFRNIIKIIILIGAIALTQSLNADMSTNVAGNLGLGAFLFFLFFATVSTTYDLGGGWFLKVTTGVGLGGAVVGFFLVAILSELLMNWVAAHTAIVIGILLASFVIHEIIEIIKYFEMLPMFFNITGIFCALMYAIEMLFAFLKKPPFIFAMEGEGFVAFLRFIGMAITVLFTLVNIISRATQAYWVED